MGTHGLRAVVTIAALGWLAAGCASDQGASPGEPGGSGIEDVGGIGVPAVDASGGAVADTGVAVDTGAPNLPDSGGGGPDVVGPTDAASPEIVTSDTGVGDSVDATSADVPFVKDIVVVDAGIDALPEDAGPTDASPPDIAELADSAVADIGEVPLEDTLPPEDTQTPEDTLTDAALVDSVPSLDAVEAVDVAPDAGPEPDTGPEPDPAEPFFALGPIPVLDIKLSEAAIDSLFEEPKEYVMGDVHLLMNGELVVWNAVGVRLKGNYGSFRTLDQKAAFLLKFDKFVDGQELFGMKKLAVNNMVQDKSMIHEKLGYELFHASDVPAPRSAYAWVRVNGEDYGLYATVEVTDNPSFLDKWFGHSSGNLYEGQYGSDLTSDKIDTFDQDKGEDVDKADLWELMAALDGMTDPATRVEDLQEVIDLDRYVAFAATEIWLGHWDGYAWTKNNYFLYRRPDDGRWTFIPWGIDQTFKEYLDPFGGAGRVQKMCDASVACRLKLADAFMAVSARAAELGLAERAALLEEHVWSAALQDPKKEYGIDGVSKAIDATIAFIGARPADIAGKLVCADPANVDLDGDGYSGCTNDCDDGNAAIHPGAKELCNLTDDDCNGIWDDGVGCPPCVEQVGPGGTAWQMCFLGKEWAGAEAECVAQGGHLASVHGKDENAWLWQTASQIAAGSWWLGLNDVAHEGTFVWSDGTPIDYVQWGGGEPNNAGNEDCVHLADWTGGQWNDLPCGNVLPYICRIPPKEGAGGD